MGAGRKKTIRPATRSEKMQREIRKAAPFVGGLGPVMDAARAVRKARGKKDTKPRKSSKRR